jgi:hypothetical protein
MAPANAQNQMPPGSPPPNGQVVQDASGNQQPEKKKKGIFGKIVGVFKGDEKKDNNNQ